MSYNKWNTYSSDIPSLKKNDLAYITKNTRARHSLPKAEKGKKYLVLSSYTNQLGTTKYVVINENGKEHFTTEKASEKVDVFILKNSETWMHARKMWLDETYVPVFGVHTYDYIGMPYVSSRDGEARYIKKLDAFAKSHSSVADGVWINKSQVHDADVKLFMSSSFPPDAKKQGELSETVTFRVPMWLAEKHGFFNDNKG